MKLLFFLLLLPTFVFADLTDRVIKVKGGIEKAGICLIARGHTARTYRFEAGEILLPATQKNVLWYYANDKVSTFVYIDSDLQIEQQGEELKFIGENAAINDYLYGFTKRFVHAKATTFKLYLQGIVTLIPHEYRSLPARDGYDDPVYTKWMLEICDDELKHLKETKLPKSFKKMFAKRIEFMWQEMVLRNYRITSSKDDFLAEPYKVILDFKFDDSFTAYPDHAALLQLYCKAYSELSKDELCAESYIVDHAKYLKTNTLQEIYALEEAKNIVRNKWSYDYNSLWKQCDEVVKSVAIKSQIDSLRQLAEEGLTSSYVDKQMPSFVLLDRNDKKVDMSQYKGKYLFIDFWASWCGPCKVQIPFIQKMEKELHGENINFLSVSIDVAGRKAEWVKLLDEYGITQHYGIVDESSLQVLKKDIEITSIPRFMLLDPNGKVVMDKARRPSDSILKAQLLDILK